MEQIAGCLKKLGSAGYTERFVENRTDLAVLQDLTGQNLTALVLNPNLAAAWYFSGWVKAWLSEPELSIEHLERAMRLNPLDPLMALMWTAVAFAHFLAGRYDEASSWAAMALRENPTLHSAIRVAAAANAMTGRLEKAQKEIALMRQLDPTLRVSNLSDVMPFRRPEDLAKYAEALRMAGLPD